MDHPRSQSKKRWTRVPHKKVKTGCITCRTRRVKCDETRPSCLRCWNFGRLCEGYQTIIQSFGQKNSRELLPRPREAALQNILSHGPVTVLFKNSHDYRYFRLFLEQTSSQLSGFHNIELWNRLIPQACQNTPSIRHAVVAVAALDLTAQKLQQSSIPSRMNKCHGSRNQGKQRAEFEEAIKHHQYALRQYSRAIKEMRCAASTAQEDIRTSLIATLLIICFETYHGNHESALSQVEAALNLLASWRENYSLSSQALFGMVSPDPLVVEDELVQLFTRLDAWAMTFIDCRPRKLYSGSSLEKTPLPDDLFPEHFSNANEAWLFASLMVRRLFILCSAISGDFGRGFFKQASHLPPGPTDDIYYPLSVELERFRAAFLPLWDAVKDDINHDDYILAATSQMSYLACTIIHIPVDERGAFARSLDIQVLHEEMLALAEKILTHPKIKTQTCLYSFESQVVAPLYSVVWKSPFPDTRKRALDLLLSSHRREGFWDSTLSARVGMWLRQVEEEGLDMEGIAGYVPLEMKIINVDVEFDMLGQTANVSCMKPRLEAPEVYDLKRTTMRWG